MVWSYKIVKVVFLPPNTTAKLQLEHALYIEGQGLKTNHVGELDKLLLA